MANRVVAVNLASAASAAFAASPVNKFRVWEAGRSPESLLQFCRLESFLSKESKQIKVVDLVKLALGD